MFVLLFAFVFGSSINVPGTSYREWLVPGIMAQTIVFSSFIVALGLTTDLDKGIVDRLKSLPVPRSTRSAPRPSRAARRARRCRWTRRWSPTCARC